MKKYVTPELDVVLFGDRLGMIYALTGGTTNPDPGESPDSDVHSDWLPALGDFAASEKGSVADSSVGFGDAVVADNTDIADAPAGDAGFGGSFDMVGDTDTGVVDGILPDVGDVEFPTDTGSDVMDGVLPDVDDSVFGDGNADVVIPDVDAGFGGDFGMGNADTVVPDADAGFGGTPDVGADDFVPDFGDVGLGDTGVNIVDNLLPDFGFGVDMSVDPIDVPDAAPEAGDTANGFIGE